MAEKLCPMRGYYGVGVENSKTPQNIGTLYRTAFIYGAAFIFTVGKRYEHQCSDTVKSYRHLPLYNFPTIDNLVENLPYGCPLIGVELDDRARELNRFTHPERACYLLGAEDHGLTKEAISKCHTLVRLPGDISLNVSVAGSIVLYDRFVRQTATRRDWLHEAL